LLALKALLYTRIPKDSRSLVITCVIAVLQNDGDVHVAILSACA
jgi:hypothetical protein